MKKLWLVLAVAAFAQPADISGERIRAHVKFLASDLLEGRGVGARGGDIATEYIAAQFALAGAKPAGDAGTYFQNLTLVGVEPRASSTLKIGDAQLKWLDDFVGVTLQQKTDAAFDGEAGFVGHGIVAPEYQWDDYAGADVRGKVVVLFTNEPPSDDPKFFTGPALTYYGRWTYKYEEAARHGAVGVLIIHRTVVASYGWDVVRNSWSGEHSYLQNDPLATLKAAGWIQYSVAQQLFRAAGLDPDKMIAAADTPGFHPVVLRVHLKATIVSLIRRFHSDNVVAMLPGTQTGSGTASGQDQAVMYTAHYDH